MSHAYGPDVIVVEDVLVVSRSEFGWQCEIAGERVFVSTLQVPARFLMPPPGQRGRVKLIAATAVDLLSSGAEFHREAWA
jgi:hypothetical protein